MGNRIFAQKILIITLIIGGYLIFAAPATAAIVKDSGGVLSNFLDTFENQTVNIAGKFYNVALVLFWLLAGIQFSWSCVQLGVKGDFSVVSATQLLIREIMFIGFFFWLLTQYSELGNIIAGGLRKLGGSATNMDSISPGSVFEKGMEIAWEALKASFRQGVTRGVAAILPCLIILACFAMAAAAAMVYLIEFYIVVPAGVILLGLGGSTWTKSYAEGYIRTLVSVGLKLLCLQIVLGICINFIDSHLIGSQIPEKEDSFFQHLFNLSGLAIITHMIIKQVPEFAAALVSGGSFSSGASALTSSAAATFGAAAGMAAGAMKTGATAALAYSDAMAAFSGDGGGGGNGGSGGEVGNITPGSSSSGGSSDSSLDSALRGDQGDSGDSGGGTQPESAPSESEGDSTSSASEAGAGQNSSAPQDTGSSGTAPDTASTTESGQTSSDTESSPTSAGEGSPDADSSSSGDSAGGGSASEKSTTEKGTTASKSAKRAAICSAMRVVMGFGPTGAYTPGSGGAYRWGDMSSKVIPQRMSANTTPMQRKMSENMANSINQDN